LHNAIHEHAVVDATPDDLEGGGALEEDLPGVSKCRDAF